MRDILRFHAVHGTGLTISDNHSIATRSPTEFCNGIAFSDKPLKLCQKVSLELTQSDQFSGALRIGVTTLDPAKLATKDAGKPDLPRYACPELTSKPGYWARPITEQYADTGNRVTVYVNKEGALHFFVNNEHCGVLICGLPVHKTMWLMVDLFGNTTQAKFVTTDSAPVEIVARGADALQAYQMACESGTQAVFRTRLMIVGQDRVGKTSLKHTLIGLRNISAEESTDGIDLSASCSFNTTERNAWKYALEKGRLQNEAESRESAATELRLHGLDEETQDNADSPVIQTFRNTDDIIIEDSSSKLENEYHEALANNIVQELLFRRKQQRQQQSGSASGRHRVAPRHTVPSMIIQPRPLSKPPNRNRERAASLDTESSTPRTTSDVTTPRPLVSSAETKFVRELNAQDLLHEMPQQVVDLVEAKLQSLGDENTKKKLTAGNNIELSIWDFAGQAVYYTTHQVFLSSRAVYVIVFNLCHDLEAVARNTPEPFHQLHQPIKDETELSNLDYMNFWMSCIHAHASTNSRACADNQTLSPPIFIVGTHRDSLHADEAQKQKIVDEKFAQIRDYIYGKSYEQHVVNTFYAVENSLDQTEHDQQLIDLRQHIESVASREAYMGEQIPLKWLKFECAVSDLVSKGTHFASIDQIREVAHEIGINDDEGVKTMLAFYHDLGVLVYFGQSANDAILRQTVILKPAWLVNMFRKIITAKENNQIKQIEMWQRLVNTGVLEDKLMDELWADVKEHKQALIGLMQQFQLLCRRNTSMTASLSRKNNRKSYFVPACIRPTDSSSITLYSTSGHDITFYYDFHGFLPDGLFHRMTCQCISWSLDNGGHEPQLMYRQARFFLDLQHDFVIHMQQPNLARIKVVVLRVVSSVEDTESIHSDGDSQKTRPSSAPAPSACAKLRHFLEGCLNDLRENWMKRISYEACVCCYCERACDVHSVQRCSHAQCLHFLNLDDCISNKIVCCEHRRIKTAPYRRWFPSPQAKTGPVLADNMITRSGSVESDLLPSWIKGAAKLLTVGGTEGQDWLALAKVLGYKQRKINQFSDEYNPALALITDWILSSGNSTMSVDMLTSFLEQLQRDDVADVIQKGQEEELSPAQVFISYQWEQQDEVSLLRGRLESAGYTCWMDIGQMGGGDQLYSKIDEGMRHAKMVISCASPKYCVSHYCLREMHLADLLRKPIIPVLFEQVPWPPPGALSLIYSQLVYVDMKGVGGHGGAGIHADTEDKYQSIIQRLSAHCTPQPQEQIRVTSQRHHGHHRHTDSDSSFSSLNSEETGANDGSRSLQRASLHLLNQNRMMSPGSNRTANDGVWRRQNTSANRHSLPSHDAGGVETTNVTNCAVCVIL